MGHLIRTDSRRTGVVRTSFAVALVTLLVTACATAPPPPVRISPKTAETIARFPDPRLGYPGAVLDTGESRRFDQAWSEFTSGQLDAAEQDLQRIEKRVPGYGPALLAEAAIAIVRGNLDPAQALIDRADAGVQGYTAATAYRAELAFARGDLASAWQTYASIASPDSPPSIRNRFGEIRKDYFEQLVTAANQQTQPREAVKLLQQALDVEKESSAARLLLVQQLIVLQDFERARKEIEPLFNQGYTDRPEVQEALADIAAGQGRYQDAIARLERLQRRYPDRNYSQKLSRVKARWMEANLPPQYHEALDSQALTREQLATLLYWKVSAVRFARNLPEPPIAIDIPEEGGREEFVRALALGIFRVDPVTRRAYPEQTVTAANFLRISSRAMLLGGAPRCAQEGLGDPDELQRAERVLEGCGIQLRALPANPDAPLSGTEAARVLDAIGAGRPSAENR
ncbi:MAG: tetratricopeptide repeat protein [Thermoanaerobaculia bacterium]